MEKGGRLDIHSDPDLLIVGGVGGYLYLRSNRFQQFALTNDLRKSGDGHWREKLKSAASTSAYPP